MGTSSPVGWSGLTIFPVDILQVHARALYIRCFPLVTPVGSTSLRTDRETSSGTQTRFLAQDCQGPGILGTRDSDDRLSPCRSFCKHSIRERHHGFGDGDAGGATATRTDHQYRALGQVARRLRRFGTTPKPPPRA